LTRRWPLALLTALLAPVLIAQGRQARKRTPRLPEPEGPRSGLIGDGSSRAGLRLLIAGDSAAAGVGVGHQREALSGCLTAALADRFDLDWRLVAQTGYDTRDLIHRLSAEPARPFDLVVLSLGVNDVTGTLRIGHWLDAQRELIDLLCDRFEAERILLSAVPPMEVFRALPQPLRVFLGLRARAFNCALADALPGWSYASRCTHVSLPPLAHPDALAADGFHPGALTYRVWATELARVACQGSAALAGPRG
jgi:lysophospholipase L1-like esterase